MDSYGRTTRADERYNTLHSVAKKGQKKFEGLVVYPSEIKILKKDGFILENKEVFNEKLHLFKITVSWSEAFGFTIPPIVYSYIIGSNNNFPKTACDNLAKKLYVIASRKSYTNK